MKAILVLEDGTTFEGVSVGAAGEAIGDVVFTTAMSGFVECLTDPCYHGMILSFTDPLVDNYGVNSDDFESDKVQCVGAVMKDPSATPSNFRCEISMPEFLAKNKIVGISGIDTRMLTRILRDRGTMKGLISTDEKIDVATAQAKMKAAKQSTADVSVKKAQVYGDQNGVAVTLLDLGVKNSFINTLTAEGYRVTRLPSNSTLEQIKATAPKALVVSDGPGDPNGYPELVKLAGAVMKAKIPTMAVGLGQQLFALAAGLKVVKMPFGHHGNHPVKDLARDTVFATFPNQNYTIDESSVKADTAVVTHINMHDRTVEGIRFAKAPVFTLQFYPDGVKGIHNASYLMNTFAELTK